MSVRTALVIDDEPMMRQLVRRMLEPELCRVIEADGGESGLRILQQHGAAVDVVLTDLVMPEIDGYDVVRVLARYCPGLPVLCMSGYVSVPGGAWALRAPLLQKPFTELALRQTVAPLLERGRAAASAPRAVDLVAAARELRRA
jgi:two-component system cell cycle sensor histidine kinase/response regulator CckA